MKDRLRINNRIAVAAGSALALAIGSTSSFGVVVISDGFGDADRNNNGLVDRFDTDISADGTVGTFEAPLFPGSSINEANTPTDPADVGIKWLAANGWTSSPGTASGEFDAKFHNRIIDDSAGVLPDGPGIDSGLALSMNSKGRGAVTTAFFGQTISLGTNVGDQVKVSFDLRIWDSSPNLNTDGTPADRKGDLRWGIFQDTDNQIGTSNPFAGAPDVNTGIPTAAVWGQDDGFFRGDLGGAGGNGDAGWYTRIKLFDGVPQDGADDLLTGGGGPRINEEVNGSTGSILNGSDNDFVSRPDELNPNFTALLGGKVYNLSLTLERTADSIFATYTVNNLTDGTTFSFGGEESLNDGSIPGSGGIESDSWDYFAIRNSSSSTVGEDDYDLIIDNFLVELFSASVPLEGDLNGDGFVGIADLNIVLGVWNQNVTPGDPLQGDPTGDGFVGIGDLNVVLGNWNAGTPPSAAAIPEPATLALLGLGGLAMLRRRRRR